MPEREYDWDYWPVDSSNPERSAGVYQARPCDPGGLHALCMLGRAYVGDLLAGGDETQR